MLHRKSRVFKSTIVLYARQAIVILVNLYTLSLVLDILGIVDYGIYIATTGLVTLGAFLPGAMASATQRFFAFALGQADHEQLKKTFSVNLIIYALIALLALATLETVGLWFVNNHLVIPPHRFEAAYMLYQFAIWTFVIGMFVSPLIAILVAHEDMHIYAALSVAEVLMRLAVVLWLTVAAGDKLELYGALLLVVAVVNMSAYAVICAHRYPECQFRKLYWDSALLKQIAGFTGWTLFGHLTSVVRNQAVTLLLNQMFNPVTVAARAVAMTVASQVMAFASNFNTGLYPPIIMSYAADKKEEMFSLVVGGSKLTFFLIWLFALPMLLEMDIILRLWLNTPPADAVLFTQLALVETLIVALSLPLATAARAPGKMRSYELTLGLMQLGMFAVSWYVLKMGFPPYSVFVVAIIINLMMLVVRLLIVSRLIGLRARYFAEKVLLPLSGVIVLSATPMLLLKSTMSAGLVNSIILGVVCALLSAFSMYYIGLDARWRAKVRATASASLKQLFRV